MKTARAWPAEKEGARIIAEFAQALSNFCTEGFTRTILGHSNEKTPPKSAGKTPEAPLAPVNA
jgi:hypothetical protein